jgi:putative transposase
VAALAIWCKEDGEAQMMLAHKIRLVPTKAQEDYFRRACGTARFAYNWALAEWKRRYEAGEKPDGYSLHKAFNAVRREKFPWTYDVSKDCTAQPFANLDRAFQLLFKKVMKYPRFKKKGGKDSFYASNAKTHFDGKRVKLPVIGWVRLREPLRFAGKLMCSVIVREADAWYISAKVELGDYHRERTGDGVVGADLGLTTLVTLSTGEKIEGPKAMKKAQRKMVRLQRSLARKVKGSANYAKAKMKLSRAHARVAHIRSDALHKLTTRFCRENQTVGMESLNAEGMLRNHYISGAVRDAAFGEICKMMIYKSDIFRTDLRFADRFYPSSKTCSCCGAVKDSLSWDERTFKCDSCGVEMDRDVNAAVNLSRLPRGTGNVKPVERKALTKTPRRRRETGLGEAGSCEGRVRHAPVV